MQIINTDDEGHTQSYETNARYNDGVASAQTDQEMPSRNAHSEIFGNRRQPIRGAANNDLLQRRKELV